MAEGKNLEGIRGWLLLPLLGLIISPFWLGWTIINDILPVFTEGHWDVVTDPESSAYHPMWAPVIIFEGAGNLALLAFTLVLLVQFLRKLKGVPKLMIIFYLATLAFVVMDLLLVRQLPGDTEITSDDIKGLFRGVTSAAIWIPYFLKSKRVAATFVR